MIISMRNVGFAVLATAALIVTAEKPAQAELGPKVAVVYSPVNGQIYGYAYEWVGDTPLIVTGTYVKVITEATVTPDGSLALYFDEYYIFGQPDDTSLWRKHYSGQIVLSDATAAGGAAGFLIRTVDHRTGQYVIPNPLKHPIAIDSV